MKKLLLILSLLLVSIVGGYADSPLTSTDFYRVYLDVPEVKKAAENPGKLTRELMEYLRDDNNPLDKRIAVVNAVGFNSENQTNFRDYIEYCYEMFELENGVENDTAVFILDDPYLETEIQIDLPDSAFDEEAVVVEVDDSYMSETVIENSTAEQLAVLVYLQAMSNYWDTLNNYAFMEYTMQAPLMNQQSFMLPMGLVLAQTALDTGDWGNIYPAINFYLFSPEIKDVRPEAIDIIMEYINEYKEYADRP